MDSSTQTPDSLIRERSASGVGEYHIAWLVMSYYCNLADIDVVGYAQEGI